MLPGKERERMSTTLKLPVGIDDFKKLRENRFYYVDKTALIEQLLGNWSEVNLFTRPRRFGKTLNMSMLKAFFEIGADRSLFEGLYISRNAELCDEHMGKYPVIFLTLKGVEGLTFEEAKRSLIDLIGEEADRYRFLLDSYKLSSEDKERYRGIASLSNGLYVMSDDVLYKSIQTLSKLLFKHYGQKAVILIDEYDVPLDKAFQNGYYREMVSLIRAMFGNALKTNDYLQFAVLTGCLRIYKESIFTGLNNFRVHSITNPNFDEQFGFTDDEVRKLLCYYGMESRMDDAKEWYDGYHFGDTDVYCPWDVINFAYDLRCDSDSRPQAYWINTSGNGLVKRFIDKADQSTRDEIEKLMAGEYIEKAVRLELTYDELDNTIDNLWSVLFATGYLTHCGMTDDGAYKLIIPNREVREVYKLQIQDWFKSKVISNTEQLAVFWKAIESGDTVSVERYLTRLLNNTISVFDVKGRNEAREVSYHTMLVGILTGNADWGVRSNVESGEGFADIIVKTDDPEAGIVIEIKYSKDYAGLESACQDALKQIKDKHYDQYLRNENRHNILIYGLAFCKKTCKAAVEKL